MHRGVGCVMLSHRRERKSSRNKSSTSLSPENQLRQTKIRDVSKKSRYSGLCVVLIFLSFSNESSLSVVPRHLMWVYEAIIDLCDSTI